MICPKCLTGLMYERTDMWGKQTSCYQCGEEIHPPLEPDIAEMSVLKLDRLPSTGTDSYTWKEKHTRRHRGGRPPTGGRNPYRKVEK